MPLQHGLAERPVFPVFYGGKDLPDLIQRRSGIYRGGRDQIRDLIMISFLSRTDPVDDELQRSVILGDFAPDEHDLAAVLPGQGAGIVPDLRVQFPRRILDPGAEERASVRRGLAADVLKDIEALELLSRNHVCNADVLLHNDSFPCFF